MVNLEPLVQISLSLIEPDSGGARVSIIEGRRAFSSFRWFMFFIMHAFHRAWISMATQFVNTKSIQWLMEPCPFLLSEWWRQRRGNKKYLLENISLCWNTTWPDMILICLVANKRTIYWSAISQMCKVMDTVGCLVNVVLCELLVFLTAFMSNWWPLIGLWF